MLLTNFDKEFHKIENNGFFIAALTKMTELNIVKLPHHEQEKLCETRPAYRQGRKLTAVKVARRISILCKQNLTNFFQTIKKILTIKI